MALHDALGAAGCAGCPEHGAGVAVGLAGKVWFRRAWPVKAVKRNGRGQSGYISKCHQVSDIKIGDDLPDPVGVFTVRHQDVRTAAIDSLGEPAAFIVTVDWNPHPPEFVGGERKEYDFGRAAHEKRDPVALAQP